VANLHPDKIGGNAFESVRRVHCGRVWRFERMSATGRAPAAAQLRLWLAAIVGLSWIATICAWRTRGPIRTLRLMSASVSISI